MGGSGRFGFGFTRVCGALWFGSCFGLGVDVRGFGVTISSNTNFVGFKMFGFVLAGGVVEVWVWFLFGP